jgi:hypothetical protein
LSRYAEYFRKADVAVVRNEKKESLEIRREGCFLLIWSQAMKALFNSS